MIPTWILCLFLLAPPPGLEGLWQGTLSPGAVPLRVVLKVSKAADGSLTAKLDSIDQGARDLPVSGLVEADHTVKFALTVAAASFEGTRSGEEIVGQWTQGGVSLPLTFKRTDRIPEPRRPQTPRKPYPYDEQEVTYENNGGGAKLAGTLTLPRAKGPFPVVLLITGSGQQDRDETIMGHRPFLVLADHLTRRGIAVLRVDDRGVGGSTGAVKTATTEDFAGDVAAGVEFLKSRPQIDPKRIGLIGHSEGGVIAPMVASRSSDVAFVVLMAGTGVPGEQVIHEQAVLIAKANGASEEAVAAVRRRQDQAIAKMRKTRPWLDFFLTFDPATVLKKVTCPVLAINGAKDLQVPPGQNLPAILKALEEGGNRDYTIAKLPRLNHLFQTAETGSPAEYARIEQTMAPLALETISEWILARFGK